MVYFYTKICHYWYTFRGLSVEIFEWYIGSALVNFSTFSEIEIFPKSCTKLQKYPENRKVYMAYRLAT